jgi:hypothetical protein
VNPLSDAPPKKSKAASKDPGNAQTIDVAGVSVSSPKKKKKESTVLSARAPIEETRETTDYEVFPGEPRTNGLPDGSAISPKKKEGASVSKKASVNDLPGPTLLPKSSRGEIHGAITSRDEREKGGTIGPLSDYPEWPRKLIGRTVDSPDRERARDETGDSVLSQTKTKKGAVAAWSKTVPEESTTNAPPPICTGSPKKSKLKVTDSGGHVESKTKATGSSVIPKKKKTAAAPPVTKPKKKGKPKAMLATRNVTDTSSDSGDAKARQSVESDFNSSFDLTGATMQYESRGSASALNFSFETDDDSTVVLEFDGNYSIGEASEEGRPTASSAGDAVCQHQDDDVLESPGKEVHDDNFEQKPFTLHFRAVRKCHSPGTSQTETESYSSNEGSYGQAVSIVPFGERCRHRSSILRR